MADRDYTSLEHSHGVRTNIPTSESPSAVAAIDLMNGKLKSFTLLVFLEQNQRSTAPLYPVP